MDPLTAYYKNQAGAGGLGDLIGPVYRGSFHVQQGHGIGSFLSGLFRLVRPVLVSGAKALGRGTLATGANILSDIASKNPNTKIKNIIANRVTESTNKLVSKLQGKGKKRKRKTTKTSRKKTKRDIFS